MTIGDVLAVIALIILVTSSWGALIIFASYVAPQTVASCRVRLQNGFGWCLFRGAATTIIIAILVAARAAAMVGPFRLLPFAVAGALFLAASVGAAAVVQILAERMDTLGKPQDCPDIIRTVRATAVYCLAGLFPVGGWFIVAPLAFFATIGSMFGKLPNSNASIPSLKSVNPDNIELARS